MNKVHAQKIITVNQWQDTWTLPPGPVVYNYNVEGERYAITPTFDTVPAEVGDWLVSWENGVVTVVKASVFTKYYHHIEGNHYETNFQPLFFNRKVKEHYEVIHDGRA
jgi:hypothetical protein